GVVRARATVPVHHQHERTASAAHARTPGRDARMRGGYHTSVTRVRFRLASTTSTVVTPIAREPGDAGSLAAPAGSATAQTSMRAANRMPVTYRPTGALIQTDPRVAC